MHIITAQTQEALTAAASLAALLWPDTPAQLHYETLQQASAGAGVILLACADDEAPVGFAQCQLRHDYVEGTDSSPVGYLEGVYIVPANRRQGIARALVDDCRAWAKQQGCSEFASDCELDNDASRAFHLAVGFAEANRIICFTQQL